jgi:regulator of RNase E activity RraA
MNVQVYARGHSTLGQSPFVRPSVLQEAITIRARPNPGQADAEFESVTINPGDFILADEDGVVTIPQKDIDEALQRCKKNTDVDARCMADLRNGRSVSDTFKEHRGK